MTTSVFCGIDFGTSNSSLAVANQDNVFLVPVENNHQTIPSAMFFARKDNHAYFGREATERFLTRQPGRLMRSLKRVLGSSAMRQGTMVNGELMKFDQIIAAFLDQMKRKAEADCGTELRHVVMGRPVHFVDNDPAADQRAENELKQIARNLGFEHVGFQFEPIAAAFAHEAGVTGEKLAMVVDLGGGTSDFTIIRLSRDNATKHDRNEDILANTGVRLGGNDFDRDLSLAEMMPELGFRSKYGTKNLEVPSYHYFDLSEWSKVNFLYTNRILFQAKQLLRETHDPVRYGRLISVLEQETGHAVLAETEKIKIGLASSENFAAALDFIDQDLRIHVARKDFDAAINTKTERIVQSARECLQAAGVTPERIGLVIMTGGSTEIPLIQHQFRQLFPDAEWSEENKLSSVGLGLAYDARNRFS
ncbi:Hsp70 family protein [Dyadobacter fanqingshengii]|uniref:Hsp70 family protein n=1 Tax=Dyadobacter fanqingshengii TaxID=2906443 RepID=A0A9X1PEW9_9BACT|nr:Hsp70 family protein [Dyadobacter fanqingshengii]MCF0041997.1 Hsp70 family protein [Dyadobacter fanqingshengii]USJ38805.1 Hsp70 family protein [Dyadobacter fanqingshengii]